MTAFVVLALLITAPLLFAQEGETVAKVFIDEDFSDGMDNWWVEGNQRVWIEDGRLHVDADPPEGSEDPFVATIWHHTPIEGDVQIEFDAHVISSSTNVNNINFFFYYTDPEGTPLYDTREDRADGGYRKYHELNGNIITFLNDHRTRDDDETEDLARIRIRHCPGFVLLGETFNYHCRAGVTYRVKIIRRGNFIEFHVDDNYLLGVHTPERWEEGLIGLRTFRTYLWWDNIRVTALD